VAVRLHQLAGAQLALDAVARHQAHAQVGTHRLDEHREQVEAVPAAGMHRPARDAGPIEPGLPGAQPRAQLQQRHIAEVPARHRALPARARRARHHAGFGHQRPRLRARPHRVVVLHRHVEGRLLHVDLRRENLQVQAAGRLQRGEGGQAGHQPAFGEDRHRAHQQARAVGALRHRLQRVVLQAQQVARDLRVVAAARVGERRAARRALHQPHPELRLQLAQLLAHGAVREAQFLGRLADAAVAGHGIEDEQGTGGGDVAAHVRKTDGAED